MKGLTQNLNTLCDPQPYSVSWYLKDLASGKTADRAGKCGSRIAQHAQSFHHDGIVESRQ